MIKEAYADYTGGNIWVFHGKLEDGSYFLSDDAGWTLILDEDPSDLEISTYQDWQDSHTIRELKDPERKEFLAELLRAVKENPDFYMNDLEIYGYRNWWKF